MSDEDLLSQFARDGSNAAFAELVRRYLSLVYSAAQRQVQSASLAEDIAQSVFIDLAKNAGQLKPGQPLAAWLYLVTRRTTIDAIRRESRRRSREQTASEIAAMTPDPTSWTQIEPLLDEAMETLSDADRQALLLRYFSSKSLREVGETLGTSEDAAQKRVSRALEQLRAIFIRRGVVITAAGLASDLSANVALSVPIGLNASVAAGAVSAAALAHTTAAMVMTTLNKTLIATSLVLVASLIYESQLLDTERNRQFELEQKLAAQQSEAQKLTQERDRAAELLGKKHEELASELARAREADATDSALEAWLGRVTRLKERLAQMPEKNIPEMRFLTSHDWLTVTLNNNLQTEAKVRAALTDLRRIAKLKPEISQNLLLAFRGYSKNHDGRAATDVTQIRPYLKPALDDDILQRYAFVPVAASFWPDRPETNGTDPTVFKEKDVVDEDSDVLAEFSGGGTILQIVNHKLGDTVNKATDAFRKANGGQEPTAAAQLLPYVTTPVDESKFREFWEARNER